LPERKYARLRAACLRSGSVFGIGIAHGFATLGTIGFEGRFDYAAIGTVSNVASRLCDEAKPGQILISPRVLTKVENAVQVELVGEFELKGIRRPLAAYNVLAATGRNLESIFRHCFRSPNSFPARGTVRSDADQPCSFGWPCKMRCTALPDRLGK
jgi:class 3 adenylate cyclase